MTTLNEQLQVEQQSTIDIGKENTNINKIRNDLKNKVNETLNISQIQENLEKTFGLEVNDVDKGIVEKLGLSKDVLTKLEERAELQNKIYSIDSALSYFDKHAAMAA